MRDNFAVNNNLRLIDSLDCADLQNVATLCVKLALTFPLKFCAISSRELLYLVQIGTEWLINR